MEQKGEFQERETIRPAEAVQLPTRKDTKSGLVIVLLLIIIVGMGAYIAADKLNLLPGNDSDSSSSSNLTDCGLTSEVEDEVYTDPNGVEYTMAQEIEVKSLISDLRDGLAEAADSYLATETFTENGAMVEQSDGWRMRAGRGYGVVFTAGTPESVTSELMSEGGYADAIKTVMTKHGLEEKEQLMWGTYNFESSTGLTCQYANGIPFDVTCSYKSWVSSDDYALASALQDAIKAKEGKYSSYISVSEDDIEAGGTAGYDTVTAGIGDAGAMFYRAEGGDWVYVTFTNGIPACSDFDEEATKAYKGKVGCLEDGETKKVGE